MVYIASPARYPEALENGMKNDCLDAVISELDAAGVRYETDVKPKHVHIRFGKDLERMHVVAKTPSDWRAHKNERASIRRDLRELGYLSEDQEPELEASPVITVRGDMPKCTSIDIAHNFGKAHKDVLRSIDAARDTCGLEFDQRNFAPIEYTDPKGRTYRAFEMTRDGFSLVSMGFTGATAMRWKVAYIDAFGRMESALVKTVGMDELNAMRSELDAVLELMASLEPRQIEFSQPSPRRQYLHPRTLARKTARQIARRQERAA